MELKVADIDLSYGATKALDGCNLSVAKGELVALVGESGSGKTSLLRVISGVVPPSAGQIVLGDRSITAWPIGDRKIAFIQEDWALYPHLSVMGNCDFPLRMQGLPKDVRRARVIEEARGLGLESLLDRLPAQLSAGQRQRVALGRALVRNDLNLLLADEPFSNLDLPLRLRLRVEFRKAQQARALTTLLVTHDQTDAMAVADRIAFMASGRILQIGYPNELASDPQHIAVAAFIGSPPFNILPAAFSDQGPKGAGPLCAAGSPPKAIATLPLRAAIAADQIEFCAESEGRLVGRIVAFENTLPRPMVVIECDGEILRAVPPKGRRPELGEVVSLTFDANVLLWFNTETGERYLP